MSEKPKWKVARLDDVERRGRDIPVREYMGIHAFGINAYTPSEDGTLVGEHDESGSGQEELYIVLDGSATFEVDGDTVDAPAGTFVFVGPEARRKATGDGTVLAVGATPGEAYQAIDWGEAWAFHNESMRAYSEQRYAGGRHRRRDGRAPPAVRRALAAVPRAGAQGRRLRGRTRRPAVRASSPLSVPFMRRLRPAGARRPPGKRGWGEPSSTRTAPSPCSVSSR